MRTRFPDRWLAIGTTFAPIGSALCIGYWIYGLQASPQVGFWHLPGYAGCLLVLLGLIGLAIGFFGRGTPGRGTQQSQRGGDNSVNVQIGRDVNSLDR